MARKPLRVVLDANVLFPFSLRDTLLRAAASGMFQAYWSEEILEEATRNLIASNKMNQGQATHLIHQMTQAFPESMISGYEGLISSMPNDEKDRHVAAVAVEADAQIVVTSNLRDFEPMPSGIEAQSPDDFLMQLFGLAPKEMIDLLRLQAAALKRPHVTLHDLLSGLGKTIPKRRLDHSTSRGVALQFENISGRSANECESLKRLKVLSY